jgi:hypothetical protein
VLEADVKEKIYCAIYYAVKSQTKLPPNWAVQMTLDLQVEETGALNPGLSFIMPYNPSESFTLGLGASLSSQATREDKFGSYWDLDRLKAQFTRECDDVHTIRGSSPLITNDLGLTQWLTDSLENNWSIPSSIQGKDNVFDQDSLTYHVRFVVITSGTIDPTWKLVRFTNNSSSALGSVNRTRTHDVLLTFGPKFKPNAPNIAISQHSASEFSIGVGNAVRPTIPAWQLRAP